MSPELIPSWLIFALPGVGLFLARGQLLEYISAQAESFDVDPAKALRVTSRGIIGVAGAFVLLGVIQLVGQVPHALCLYSLTPPRWPVIATWSVILGLWSLVFGWVLRAPDKEVELVLSGLLPRASAKTYRVGVALFVLGTLGMAFTMPIDLLPCVWN